MRLGCIGSQARPIRLNSLEAWSRCFVFGSGFGFGFSRLSDRSIQQPAVQRTNEVDWRGNGGSAEHRRAVLFQDWPTSAHSSGRRGVPGGASQSRVSFLLSVFHCVFKFVIYDPDWIKQELAWCSAYWLLAGWLAEARKPPGSGWAVCLTGSASLLDNWAPLYDYGDTTASITSLLPPPSSFPPLHAPAYALPPLFPSLFSISFRGIYRVVNRVYSF